MEKLLEIFKAIDEMSDKSEKYYAEIEFSGDDKKIEINIRTKKGYHYIETRGIYLKEIEEEKIEELINFIKNY